MNRERFLENNRDAWNEQVARGNRWTVPCGPELIAKARQGYVEIVLTPNRIVPQHWFPPLRDAEVLCLASGGGQQSPVLAAAGANVTAFDLSDAQLAQDRLVAEREGLELTTVQGSMDELVGLDDDRFDLVFHPCSNAFIPALAPVWKEVARVAKPGCVLMVGFINPLVFLFDEDRARAGDLSVQYSIPYSDEQQLSSRQLEQLRASSEPLMHGHSLSDQIGGQLQAGFVLTDMFEDVWAPADAGNDGQETCGWMNLDSHIASFLATRAIKS